MHCLTIVIITSYYLIRYEHDRTQLYITMYIYQRCTKEVRTWLPHWGSCCSSCPIKCLAFLSTVLWCSLLYSVRRHSDLFCKGLCIIYVICFYLCILISPHLHTDIYKTQRKTSSELERTLVNCYNLCPFRLLQYLAIKCV
jgi:hypothetical protein